MPTYLDLNPYLSAGLRGATLIYQYGVLKFVGIHKATPIYRKVFLPSANLH